MSVLYNCWEDFLPAELSCPAHMALSILAVEIGASNITQATWPYTTCSGEVAECFRPSPWQKVHYATQCNGKRQCQIRDQIITKTVGNGTCIEDRAYNVARVKYDCYKGEGRKWKAWLYMTY